MYKLLLPHVFPNEPPIRIVRSDFTKQASFCPPEVASFCTDLKPEDGFTYLHLNALGSQEVWGSNVNGDGFPEEGLLFKGASHGLKTFEMFAHVYQHHCFPARTTVLMANRDRIPIEDVREGDMVMTLEGARPVTKTMRQVYEGYGSKITLRGEQEDTIATAEHPILTYKKNQVHCEHGYSRQTQGTHVINCRSIREPIGHPSWIQASELEPGDYVVIPRPKHGDEQVDPSFAKLVGWVASDGYLGKKGIIQFSISEKSREDIRSITSCLESQGVRVTVTPIPDTKIVMLSACSQSLHERLSQYVTGVLSRKTLTCRVLEWDRHSLLDLLGAYIDGDGHVARSGRNAGQLRIRSSSHQMRNALADVIRALGIPATVNVDCSPGPMKSPTNGKTYWSNGSGCVAVVPNHTRSVAVNSRKLVTRKTKGAVRSSLLRDTFLVKVTNVDQVWVSEDVFNLEVDGPHHFIANEFVAHNCNKDPAKSMGAVKIAAWNPKMHRVELIVKVSNKRGSGLIEKVASGEYPEWSMGCKVPYDTCSICKHAAKKVSEYCDHLKYAMNKILDDGRKVFAINDKPKFFDISEVVIGADKVAKTLRKVASSNRPFSSAVLGLHYYGEDEGQYPKVPKGVREKVAAQPGMPSELIAVGAEIYRKEPELAPSVIKKLAALPLAEALSTLSYTGVVLHPSEFQRLALTQAGREKKAEKLAAQGIVFPRISEDDEALVEVQDDGMIHPDHVSERAFKIARAYLPHRSILEPFLEERVARLPKMANQPQPHNITWIKTGSAGLLELLGTLGLSYFLYRRGFPHEAKAFESILVKKPWLGPILLGGAAGMVELSNAAFGPSPRSAAREKLRQAHMKVGAAWKTIGSVLGPVGLAYLAAASAARKELTGYPLSAPERVIRHYPGPLGILGVYGVLKARKALAGKAALKALVKR